MYRFFLGLVVIARAKHPIPSRTRQLSAVAPMVLRLKTWESRSPPVLVRSDTLIRYQLKKRTVAGWSSPVARQAHNLKAAGSNPAPATKKIYNNTNTIAQLTRGFLHSPRRTIAASVAALGKCVRATRKFKALTTLQMGMPRRIRASETNWETVCGSTRL